MSKWVLKGLRTGIRTTAYPAQEERAPGVSPGRPRRAIETAGDSRESISRCPTGALGLEGEKILFRDQRCIHCFRCHRGLQHPVDWEEGYEWASVIGDALPSTLGKAFGRSLHIRFVDAGACGACLSEIEQLNKPHYNMQRLGFFVTPTPREADILLVAGPVTDHMRLPLRKTFEAMPSPKRVIAIGACALSGGVFGPSFASGAGLGEFLPVDIGVPGCPPPPLAILHGLLLSVSRKPSASPRLSGSMVGREK